MNNSVYTCAASLCVTLVACGIIRMIAPAGNTSRILSVVISVFVLCSLVSPISVFVKNLSVTVDEDEFMSEEKSISVEYDNEIIRQTADYINQYVYTSLKAEGIDNTAIETVLALDENSGIYISKMNIYIDKRYTEKTQVINEVVKNTVGIEPEITER